MQDRLTKVFQKAKYEENLNLSQNIWLTLVKREKHNTQIKLWLFVLVGITSLVGLVPAFKILGSDLAQSGFYEYLSLAFSDSGLILSAWREFVFSLAESLPVLSIVFTLSLVFIFFLSLKYLMKQIIRNQLLLTA
ncbi:MAG: hypothetical protein WCW93_01720 [Candidatus Paceibacterota bacterium]